MSGEQNRLADALVDAANCRRCAFTVLLGLQAAYSVCVDGARKH
jgi:hypothetical protein